MFFTTFNGSFKPGMRPGAVGSIAALPNLNIWYDGSDTTTFQPNALDGTSMSQWNDKSTAGTAHNAAATGGNSGKPTIKTNIQAGKNIVRFDGVSNNLQVNAGNAPNWLTGSPTYTGFTIFVVAKLSATGGTKTLTSTDTNGFKFFHNGTNWCVQTASGTGTSSVVGDTTKFHIFTQIFDGTQTGNANRLKFAYDTVEYPLNFGATTVGSSVNSTATKFNVGWYNNSEYFNGDIGEIIMLTRTGSPSEVEAIENYLKNKWQITG
jgi:hypothetical protein